MRGVLRISGEGQRVNLLCHILVESMFRVARLVSVTKLSLPRMWPGKVQITFGTRLPLRPPSQKQQIDVHRMLECNHTVTPPLLLYYCPFFSFDESLGCPFLVLPCPAHSLISFSYDLLLSQVTEARLRAFGPPSLAQPAHHSHRRQPFDSPMPSCFSPPIGSQMSLSTATSLADSVMVNAPMTRSTSPAALSTSLPNSTNSSINGKPL
jgi:hypothetical protein